MELEELLASEGLGEQEAADALAWAKARAEELVAGLVADSELGPLLDGDSEGSPSRAAAAETTPPAEAPASSSAAGFDEDAPSADELAASLAALDDLEASSDDEAAPAASELAAEAAAEASPEPGEGLIAAAPLSDFADAESDYTEPPAALSDPHLLQVPMDDDAAPEAVAPSNTQPTPLPERPDVAPVQPRDHAGTEPAPAAEPALAAATADALADLPPPPSAEDVARVEEGSVARQLPQPGPRDNPEDFEDVTLPRSVPREGPAVTHSGSIEIDADEIELLDDDDLELVDDDDGGSEAPAEGGEQPEWKAALTSAQLGGGAKADEDSGLLRPSGERIGPNLTDPGAGAAPVAPVERDDSMDVDLGDL